MSCRPSRTRPRRGGSSASSQALTTPISRATEREGETTQAIGQQHTSPLRARCEARRREVALIFCCGKSLVRYGHMELYHSNCGDAVTLAMAPSDSATTLPNRSFAAGIIHRPLLPISHVTRGEHRRCPGCHKESTHESSRNEPSRSVDEFGDRMLGCKSSLSTRTRLWHDPLVEVRLSSAYACPDGWPVVW